MRRKLFSKGCQSGSYRRRLFSDNIPVPVNENEMRTIICSDCGKTYKYSGSSLKGLICTNCGSDRFEFLENIDSIDEFAPNGSSSPVDVAFSETRRKLFCNCDYKNNKPMPNNPSGSLTSMNPGPEHEETLYKCPDCGTEFMSDEVYVDLVNCPKCGGNRCRKEYVEKEESFSDVSNDELDEILSKYKGKSVNISDLESELHEKGIYDEVGGVSGLVDSGYATENGDQVMFSDIADFQRKMFSKLVISVTKEFDINPVHNRDEVIDSLSEKFPGKPIMILKKAGETISPVVSTFSDNSYLKDSGIESDLKVEYGGQSIPLKDFMNIMSEEYPDAPEDIIDLLESSKVIKVNGGKVFISK